MKPHNQRKLREAIAAGAEALEAHQKRMETRPPGPLPGNLYMIATPFDFDLAWLLVRFHPDDRETCLIVPTDDTPLRDVVDVPIDEGTSCARCGESAWISTAFLQKCPRVDFVNDSDLTRVKGQLHALATGIALDAICQDIRCQWDPEYDEWMKTVRRHRWYIEEKDWKDI